MNRLMLDGARRSEGLGAPARLAGVQPSKDETPPADHIARLLADREAAMQEEQAVGTGDGQEGQSRDSRAALRLQTSAESTAGCNVGPRQDQPL